jgi:hypothetical protein
MNATGLFFLRGKPYPVVVQAHGATAPVGWAFPLVERTRRGVQVVTVYWMGADAEVFCKVHAERLKAGLALALDLEHVRPEGDGLRAHMVTCRLAPERWPSTEVDATSPSFQPQQHHAA